MTKSDASSYVAGRLGINKDDAKKVLESYVEYIQKTVSAGGQVQLRGFGRFYAQKRAAKVGRDINKNIAMPIPAVFVPKFKPAKSFALKVKAKEELDA